VSPWLLYADKVDNELALGSAESSANDHRRYIAASWRIMIRKYLTFTGKIGWSRDHYPSRQWPVARIQVSRRPYIYTYIHSRPAAIRPPPPGTDAVAATHQDAVDVVKILYQFAEGCHITEASISDNNEPRRRVLPSQNSTIQLFRDFTCSLGRSHLFSQNRWLSPVLSEFQPFKRQYSNAYSAFRWQL